jgi:hypothetical protein
MGWTAVSGESWTVDYMRMRDVVLICRASSSKTDPLVGLPRGDHWVEELQRRLHSGALRGKRKNMDKMSADSNPPESKLTVRDFTAMELGDIDKFLGAAETVLVENQRIDDPDRQSYAGMSLLDERLSI